MMQQLNPLNPHEHWMRKALDQAIRAFDEDEVPVGAVVVSGNPAEGGQVVGEGYNQREQLNDPTAHAEMIAITQAAETLGSWRLEGCTLYVTLEPCPMCAGAIVQARVPTLVYGTTFFNEAATDEIYTICSDSRLNHQTAVLSGILAADAKALLQQFFAEKRALGKK